MKRLSILLTIASFSIVMLSANAQDQNAKQVKNTGQGQPYKIAYNNLRFGNNLYTQKVLSAWKDYDNNMLDNSASLFADDIVATFPDGSVIKGKDNFIKAGKDYRNSLEAVSTTVDACTTVVSPDDPNHEVTLIWGTETDTMKDGTIKKTHLHEVWFFNKEGKVAEFHQLAAKEGEDKK